MKYLAKGVCIIMFSLLFAGAATAHPDLIVKRNAAVRFATLPTVANFPEGIAVNPHNGDIFVSTFGFNGSGTETNGIVRLDRYGHLLAVSDFSGNVPLLGLAFNSADDNVYVASVGNFQGQPSGVKRIPANFSNGAALQDVATIPNIGAPPNRTVPNPDGSQDVIQFGDNASVPNALTFAANGRMLISDSFQGAIFSVADPAACSGGCVADLVVQSGLLATTGFPPFGANGLAFNADESALFIANTGDDRVLKLTNLDTTNDLSVFTESINGADGLTVGPNGLVWVAANQGDEVVALNGAGRVVVKLGDFEGISRDGAPRGLLFPASLAIAGDNMFVTNLALPLTAAVGDEPEEDVTRYTVSRISIPPRSGGGHW